MNTVVLANTSSWDSIKNLAVNQGLGYVASQNDPTPYGVPRSRWVQNWSLFVSAGVLKPQYDWNVIGLSQAAFNLLNDINIRLGAADQPAVLMLDELNAASQPLIGAVAGSGNPSVGSRWGAYLVNGPGVNYNVLNTGPSGAVYPWNAIDQILVTSRCRLGVELYCYYTATPSAPLNLTRDHYNYARLFSGAIRPVGQRDDFLLRFLVGGSNSYSIAPDRLFWLLQRIQWWQAAGVATSTFVHPIFGVTDTGTGNAITYLSGPSPATFLDRMFYVFRNSSGMPGFMYDSNDGGVGSWKWDAANMTNTSRDQAFTDSYNWYCRPPYKTGTRLGPVPV